jgi:hypothetical protein
LQFEQWNDPDLRASIEFINKRESGRRLTTVISLNGGPEHQERNGSDWPGDQASTRVDPDTRAQVVNSLRAAVDDSLDGDGHASLAPVVSVSP